MIRFRGTRVKGGFSLVEIVLAISIFAVALVVILGLVSTLLNQSGESAIEPRAAHIANQIIRDLTPNPSGDSAAVATGNMGFLEVGESRRQVPLGDSHTFKEIVYYSLEGHPVEGVDPEVGFQVEVKMEPLVVDTASGPSEAIPARRIQQLRIEIRPANQPKAPPFLFVTRLTPQISAP